MEDLIKDLRVKRAELEQGSGPDARPCRGRTESKPRASALMPWSMLTASRSRACSHSTGKRSSEWPTRKFPPGVCHEIGYSGSHQGDRRPRGPEPGVESSGPARGRAGSGCHIAYPHGRNGQDRGRDESSRARPVAAPRSTGCRGGAQRRAHSRDRRSHRGLCRHEGPHPPDSPDRFFPVGPAGPRHDPGIACPFGSFGEEPALKLKITVDGKLSEVDVEIFEPEQPHPGYYSRPGQTRVLAAAPIAPRLAPRVAALWWPTRARSVAAPSPAPPGSRPRPGRPSRLMMSFWSSRP